ncbi:MAG: tetraacyldisaccharide 4'-kinase [Hyphomicrobiales bacterium]
MRAPSFWWKPPGLVSTLLTPLASIYGAIARARLRKQGRKAEIPVICVGNLVAGGAGKTPAAVFVAQWLLRSGRRPVFVSRGYGGRLKGPIQVDTARHTSSDCGDEPLLLAKIAPVIVSQDRVSGASMAARLGDCIVMDDGLQNPALLKDFSIAVIDAAAGIGNGNCLPAGPLRAPLAAQWPLIDAVLLVGGGGVYPDNLSVPEDIPVFNGHLEPDPQQKSRLNRLSVFAFAGIGRPSKFFATLADCGAVIEERREFPDHHPYLEAELSEILAVCRAKHWAAVTTAKDFIRIQGAFPVKAEQIHVLDVSIVVDNARQLADFISQKLDFKLSA